MICRLGAMAVLVGLLCPSLEALAQDGREVRQHGWLTDYREAKERARETGKPIMLVIRCVP